LSKISFHDLAYKVVWPVRSPALALADQHLLSLAVRALAWWRRSPIFGAAGIAPVLKCNSQDTCCLALAKARGFKLSGSCPIDGNIFLIFDQPFPWFDLNTP